MNDALPQLPEYDPCPNLWARIEADLERQAASATDSLHQAGRELPVYEPRADLWFAIEQELNTPIVRPLWNQSRIQWIWGGMVAAAAIVIVGIWLYWLPTAPEQVRIEYTVEQTDNTYTKEPAIDRQTPADKRAEEFIARQCAEQQTACQRPEVHELRSQLVELTNQRHRIEHERRVFGDDPVLLRAKEKVENQRTEVIKELITILRS